MEFDFYERYKDHPSEELMKVLQQRENYQPAVIGAINRILEERGTTAEALQMQASSIITEKVWVEMPAADGGQDLLTEPWEETKPPLWVTLVLVAVALQFAWTFLTTFYDFYQMLREVEFALFYVFYWFPIVYIPITGFLLLKKRTWGWILLFVWAVFIVGISLIWIINITWYGNFYWGRLLAPLWKLAFFGALLFCLRKPEMLRYFSVTEKRKRRTLGIGIGITIFVILIATLIPW